MEVKPGYTPDDVTALIETLRGMVDLEEGELYTLRKGKLHHVVRRDEENGLRRIMVMEEAYAAAQIMARRLRQRLRGYRPDPALVASALVMHAVTLPPDAGGRHRHRVSPAVVRPDRVVGRRGASRPRPARDGLNTAPCGNRRQL